MFMFGATEFSPWLQKAGNPVWEISYKGTWISCPYLNVLLMGACFIGAHKNAKVKFIAIDIIIVFMVTWSGIQIYNYVMLQLILYYYFQPRDKSPLKCPIIVYFLCGTSSDKQNWLDIFLTLVTALLDLEVAWTVDNWSVRPPPPPWDWHNF